jgi:TIR domain
MHDAQMEPWVHQHLLPFLQSFVGNALNRPLQIFVDRKGISSGDSWPLRIQRALAQSRCLLAVWSPLYFHSTWCRKECASMLYRETQRGFRTLNNPAGLVIPINVFDEQFFPDKARKIEWLDLRDYWIVGEGFAKTEKYVQFQDRLRDWSPQVASTVQRAPSWEESWLTEAWLDVPDDALRPKSDDNFGFVGLE